MVPNIWSACQFPNPSMTQQRKQKITNKANDESDMRNRLKVYWNGPYRGLSGGFLLLRIFSVAISVSAHVCFISDLILISRFLRWCTYELGIFHANQTTKCLRNQSRTKGEGWSSQTSWSPPPPPPPSNFIAGRPKAALLVWVFGDLRCGVLLYMIILVIYKYKNR